MTVGTLCERSHIPLHKWLLAMHLMSSSKKGMSAHQLHRMLRITYKSAWFLCHRIREAMDDKGTEPMGGTGKTVEADETYFGTKPGHTKGPRQRSQDGCCHAGRARRKARSFKVDKATAKDIVPIVRKNADKASKLYDG